MLQEARLTSGVRQRSVLEIRHPQHKSRPSYLVSLAGPCAGSLSREAKNRMGPLADLLTSSGGHC